MASSIGRLRRQESLLLPWKVASGRTVPFANFMEKRLFLPSAASCVDGVTSCGYDPGTESLAALI